MRPFFFGESHAMEHLHEGVVMRVWELQAHQPHVGARKGYVEDHLEG